jgi:nitrogen fixation NifU-like protein
MIDLRDLYQDVILDHSRHPRNFGRNPEASHSAKGNNPLCGDRVTVYVAVDGDDIREAKFEAKGCAICIASASMMTDMVKGKSVEDARAAFGRFHDALVRREAPTEADLEALDGLAALTGVREFPMRVKCATLPWHTLQAALAGEPKDVTTE